MQGYQFAHMETYSVKGAPGAGPNTTARKRNGQRAWTATEIFDEAERVALSSLHVAEGGPAPQIMPGTLGSFDGLRRAHDEAASVTERFDYTKKDGTRQQRRRKLRSDAPTLHTTIVSLPVHSADALRDPAILAKCRDVLRGAMAHEGERIAGLGGELAMGVVHLDERFVHAHLYSIDRTRGRIDHLHPGKSAKAMFHGEHAGSNEDPKTIRRGGNRAYCDAMREWQDQFHMHVFGPAGLLRRGPKAERLTTAEYGKRKRAKIEQAQEQARGAALAADVARQGAELEGILRTKALADEESERRRLALEKQAAELVGREEKAASTETRGQDLIARGQDMKASVEAYENAVKRGMMAIRRREVVYRPRTETTPAGLQHGPSAPQDKSLRKALRDAILPAYDFLVGVAEWVSGVRKREKDVRQREAEQKRRGVEQEAMAAELRRRAGLVSDGLRKAGVAAAPALADVAAGRSVRTDENAFPGAWFIDPKTPMVALEKRLNATTNLGLRAAYQATRDAALLCDENGALEAEATFGMRVIEAGASMRGFDLETGRHDPSKARSPEHANLHTDQFAQWERIIRKDRQQVRTRGG